MYVLFWVSQQLQVESPLQIGVWHSIKKTMSPAVVLLFWLLNLLLLFTLFVQRKSRLCTSFLNKNEYSNLLALKIPLLLPFPYKSIRFMCV